MSILTILLVGIGGFLGTICRYLLGTFITSVFVKGFPLSTFIVNIVGCLLIGCLVELARFHKISDTMVLFLATGFCGGFTTFFVIYSRYFFHTTFKYYRFDYIRFCQHNYRIYISFYRC